MPTRHNNNGIGLFGWTRDMQVWIVSEVPREPTSLRALQPMAWIVGTQQSRPHVKRHILSAIEQCHRCHHPFIAEDYHFRQTWYKYVIVENLHIDTCSAEEEWIHVGWECVQDWNLGRSREVITLRAQLATLSKTVDTQSYKNWNLFRYPNDNTLRLLSVRCNPC